MQLLNERQVSEQLGVTVQCLRRWRNERRELPFIKIGRLVRYQDEDVGKLVQSRLVPVEKHPVHSVPKPLGLCWTAGRIPSPDRSTVGHPRTPRNHRDIVSVSGYAV